MRNIVLARVDDRLIHGEVVTAWTPVSYTHLADKGIIRQQMHGMKDCDSIAEVGGTKFLPQFDFLSEIVQLIQVRCRMDKTRLNFFLFCEIFYKKQLGIKQLHDILNLSLIHIFLTS